MRPWQSERHGRAPCLMRPTEVVPVGPRYFLPVIAKTSGTLFSPETICSVLIVFSGLGFCHRSRWHPTHLSRPLGSLWTLSPFQASRAPGTELALHQSPTVDPASAGIAVVRAAAWPSWELVAAAARSSIVTHSPGS